MIRRLKSYRGFTLIELVMVILLLAILAAIAIPNFMDFRTEARNGATYGALGALRAAVAVATASIALKEDPANYTPKYPTVLEMQANVYDGSHPTITTYSSVNKKILDDAQGVPSNPWTLSTVPIAEWKSIWNCSSLTKGYVRSSADEQNHGWCYNMTTGQIWANSQKNNAAAVGDKENYY